MTSAERLSALHYDARRFLFSALRRRKFNRLQARRVDPPSGGYSYKPFDENRCIFVHVPKTAGVAVAQSLFGNLAGGHDSVATYSLVFSSREFREYFKFTFVRNPWDRLVSAYNFLRGGGMSEGDRAWAEENLREFDDFDDFVKRGLSKQKIATHAHFKPQYQFICAPHSRRIMVDFVGRYENLDEDFACVKSRLARTGAELSKSNARENKPRDFEAYYTAETKAIAARVYRNDIALFGYGSDNRLQSAPRLHGRLR